MEDRCLEVLTLIHPSSINHIAIPKGFNQFNNFLVIVFLGIYTVLRKALIVGLIAAI